MDLLAEIAPSLTPYRYCYNNPINFTDPYGLWETDANGNQKTNKKEDIERFVSYLNAENAMNITPDISQISTFVGEEEAGGLGKLTNGSKLLNGFSMHSFNNGLWKGWDTNHKEFQNFWYQVQGDLTPDALDPRTLGQNYLGLSYAGPHNPKKYNGKDDYSHLPDYIEDVPAYIHDKDFDHFQLNGPGPVFNDLKAHAPNVKLINSEMRIGLNPVISPVSRARALIIAIGIGVADFYNVNKNTPIDHTPLEP